MALAICLTTQCIAFVVVADMTHEGPGNVASALIAQLIPLPRSQAGDSRKNNRDLTLCFGMQIPCLIPSRLLTLLAVCAVRWWRHTASFQAKPGTVHLLLFRLYTLLANVRAPSAHTSKGCTVWCHPAFMALCHSSGTLLGTRTGRFPWGDLGPVTH